MISLPPLTEHKAKPCPTPCEGECACKGPDPATAFHAHLDVCTRCAERPFDLCAEGHVLLHLTGNQLAAAAPTLDSLPFSEEPTECVPKK